MDVGDQVLAILTAFGEGDSSVQRHEWSQAVLKYDTAMRALRRLPRSEPFDRAAFVASCLAGAATAKVELGKHKAALKAAEEALSFFEQHGNAYPAEYGKWLLALLAKGIALARLGRLAEAADHRQPAKEMLRSSLAHAPGTRQFEHEIERSLAVLDDLLEAGILQTRR